MNIGLYLLRAGNNCSIILAREYRYRVIWATMVFTVDDGQPKFYRSLRQLTGLERVEQAEVALISGNYRGMPLFVNSGVGLTGELDPTLLAENFDRTRGLAEFVRQGGKLSATHLRMPRGCITQGPHMHPGGEISYVIGGEYFDGDMDGKVIQRYPAGSIVFYAAGSTHRPLSRDGAEIFYVSLDGIVFGNDANDLIGKMIRGKEKFKTPDEAVEFALRWMIPNQKLRRELLDSLKPASP